MNLDAEIKQRFARQIRLEEIGEAGQEKLLNASVLVIGAGGLGCPALQYLAGAGIGEIGIVDLDTVEMSNLHRQLLYTPADIGKFKAEVAADALRAAAPHARITPFPVELSNAFAVEWFPKYDIIIDGTDQVHIRYLINDACRLFQKPWIYGSVNRFEGQWAVFNSGGADYRDVFPVPPDPMSMATCELVGTLGMVPGAVGVMQALDAVKVLMGWLPEITSIHTMNFMKNDMYSIEVLPGARESLDTEIFLKRDYLKYVMGFHYGKSSN